MDEGRCPLRRFEGPGNRSSMIRNLPATVANILANAENAHELLLQFPESDLVSQTRSLLQSIVTDLQSVGEDLSKRSLPATTAERPRTIEMSRSEPEGYAPTSSSGPSVTLASLAAKLFVQMPHPDVQKAWELARAFMRTVNVESNKPLRSS